MENGGLQEVLSYPLSSPAALEPPIEWDRLRRECPVAHVRFPSGDSGSLLTRYNDVKQMLSDARFTRALDAPDAARISDSETGGLFNSAMSNVLPQSGEAHLHWRRQLSKWFTVRRMNEMRTKVEAMAESLVDDMVAKGPPADLKSSFGFPLPVWVICDMLGVPDTDRDRFATWSDMILNLDRFGQDEVGAAMGEFFAYISEHIAAKRVAPGEDILSALIDATDADGESMSDMVLAASGIGLLVAGHETTANMIGKMVAMLLADREKHWERLLADRSLVRTAVEETLRMDANSGFGMVRYLPVETTVADTVLPKGTTVLCSMAAANRDESVFDHADEIDIARSPNTHLSFGVGPHSCLGQALARTELQVVLEVLLRRLPTLELAVDPAELVKLEGLIVGGLTEVPVKW
jgi:cytochrome P450